MALRRGPAGRPWLPPLAACALGGWRQPEAPLAVRYVANASMRVTLDGVPLLVDAPIRDGVPPHPH